MFLRVATTLEGLDFQSEIRNIKNSYELSLKIFFY